MNNIHSSEPTLFENSSDIRLLLNYFGHFTGRYLNTYPLNWIKIFNSHINELQESGKLNDNQKKKSLEYLNNAMKEGAFVAKNFQYNESDTWIQNAKNILGHDIESIIVHRGSSEANDNKIIDFDDFQPDISCDERIRAIPEEYLRVCQPILRSSPEILLIDPYLNPCSPYVEKVLTEFLEFISKTKKCQSIVIWSRYKEVIIDKPKNNDFRCMSLSKLKEKLTDLIESNNIQHDFELRMYLLDDYHLPERLHDRFLLSLKGGVELSQGFQTLNKGRKVKISPIGKKVHDDLLNTFLDNKNNMRAKKEIYIKV